MATFIDTLDTPTYGQSYTHPETGEWLWPVSRSFPRPTRMVWRMEDLDGFEIVLVFPYH